MSYLNDIPGNLRPSSKTNENIVPFSFFFFFACFLNFCLHVSKRVNTILALDLQLLGVVLNTFHQMFLFQLSFAQVIPLLILFSFSLVASPTLPSAVRFPHAAAALDVFLILSLFQTGVTTIYCCPHIQLIMCWSLGNLPAQPAVLQ